jgi:rifampin ADP-ribosylating transferase
VIAELDDWQAHPPQALATMLDNLARLRDEGRDVILD